MPKNFSSVSSLPSNVTFRVKGPRIFVRKLLNRDDLITVDVAKQNRIKNFYNISLDNLKIKLPLGIELLDYSPRFLKFKVERKLRKKVKVTLQVDEKTLANHNINNFELSPEYIYISGPKSFVKKITTIDTNQLESYDFEKSKSVEISVDPPSSIIEIENKKVFISYKKPISKSEFTFLKIPIIFQSSRLIKSRSSKFVRIKLFGDESVLKTINKDTLRVYANIPAKSKKNILVDLVADLPGDLEIKEIYPKKVNVELESIE